MNLSTSTIWLLSLLFSISSFAQSVDRVEPPHWYVNMHNPNLQLLVYGKDIAKLTPSIDYKGVRIEQVHKVKNPNYLFVDINIAPSTAAGSIQLDFRDGNKTLLSYDYSLLARDAASASRQGFTTKDVMYLITPDRFANGDPTNDEVAGMREGKNRAAEYGRHGGDIKGIADHLDYIKDMGFTAIWLNPVLENDQDEWSYHGYATTDYYKVDPRFGTNAEYVALSKKAKSMGIGMIMDVIVNHCGSFHWWMQDPPTDDWINYQDQPYQETNHRKSTLLDPYTSPEDRKIMTNGWFVPAMPDLNQHNDFMSTYLIQNSIWWIEYADLAGLRQDTYSYPFRDFMTDWTCAIMDEYPDFNIVGEEWVMNPNIISYWQQDKVNSDGYTSCLPSLMDFPMTMTLHKALKEEESWGTGWNQLYEMLGNDFLYPHPEDLVIFPDNHDMSRIYTQLGEDYELYQMALTYILTMRGTPQLYYGTEILMSHPGTESHGAIRADFPGGWAGDTSNVFTGQNIDAKALEAQAWVKNLLKWRQTATVVHSGTLVHFIPENGVYVYFRSTLSKRIMVILNKNTEKVDLNMARFDSLVKSGTETLNILDGNAVLLDDSLELAPRQSYVLEWSI